MPYERLTSGTDGGVGVSQGQDVKTVVNSIATGLEVAEVTIADTAGQADATDAALTTLTGRVTTAEGDIVDVSASLQDVADTVNGLLHNVALPLSTLEADAASNYAKIVAALSSYNSVTVSGGVVFINDTVVVPSGKSFKTEAGTTLKMASGSNKMVICNDGLLRAFSTATVTWSAANGRLFNVAWVSHGLSVGDGFCIQDASPVFWNTVYRVAAVVDASNFSAYAVEQPSAQPSGAVNIKKLDSNTVIDIVADYNSRGGNVGLIRETMGSIFAFVKDSDIKIRIDDTSKYVSQISGALNVDISCSGHSNSDIMKFYGAIRDIRGTVSGTSHDDCFSFQAKEPAEFIAYQPAVGSIKNITVSDFSVEQVEAGQSHSGGIVVYSDDENELSGIVIKNGNVTDSTSPALTIRAGNTFTPTAALIKDVTVDSVGMAGGTGVFNSTVTTKLQKLVIKNPIVNRTTTGARLIEITSAAAINQLTISNWVFDASAYTSGSTYFVNLQGSVDQFLLDNSKIEGSVSGNQGRLMQIGAAGVKSAKLRDCKISYLNQVCSSQTGASVTLQFEYDNCNVSNCNGGFLASSNADALLIGSAFDTITQGVSRANASGVTVRCFDYGSRYTSAVALSGTTGGIAVPMTPTTPLNITGASVPKTTTGAFAFSTTAAGTIPANRPVVCDGTNWKDMTNLSNTY